MDLCEYGPAVLDSTRYIESKIFAPFLYNILALLDDYTEKLYLHSFEPSPKR